MNEETLLQLQREIAELEQLLAVKKHLLEEAQLEVSIPTPNLICKSENSQSDLTKVINNNSTPEEKITLFRSLFKGREDVYAKRFESKKTGKSGYQPVCRNEWVRGLCEKPKINCGNCTQRLFEPVTDTVIRNHLEGFSPAKNEWSQTIPFVMGIYPLLKDETCNFLAMDFDKTT
jgi:hypothetical protein